MSNSHKNTNDNKWPMAIVPRMYRASNDKKHDISEILYTGSYGKYLK
jgi:hypothetical protein